MRDTVQNDYTGTFVDWRLKLWGVSIEASNAKLLPMPTSDDDRDDANQTVVETGSGSNASSSTGSDSKSAAAVSLPPVIFGIRLLDLRVKVIGSIFLSCALWIHLA